MDPNQARPAQCQGRAEQCEQDEGKMQQQYRIGSKAK
jgi:hypothetical protein